MKSNSNLGKTKNRILYILLGLSIAAVIVTSVWLGVETYTTRQARSYYAEMSAGIERRPRAPGDPGAPAPAPPAGADDIADPGGHGGDAGPWEPYVDFDALNERFPGIVGWIRLEGTAIDYPIMQWSDNNYFLGRLPDGTRHRSGSIFLDYRNNADFSDKNSIIYGHESRTEDMFGVLKNYRRQGFYEENPVIYIFTPEADYMLVLFAGHLVDSGVEVPPMSFEDEAAFEEHIANVKRRSFFSSDVAVSGGDRIVSLATCAYDYTNARLIIIGKLVEF